jgi:hypothetical protein
MGFVGSCPPGQHNFLRSTGIGVPRGVIDGWVKVDLEVMGVYCVGTGIGVPSGVIDGWIGVDPGTMKGYHIGTGTGVPSGVIDG